MKTFYQPEYETDYDNPCPHCGHDEIRWRHCEVIGCDDGWIDMHEYDDPLWFDEGETEICPECRGTGIEQWCPKCGKDPRATVAPAREPSTREPNDEIAQTLNLPAIAAKISQVEKSVGKRTAPYIRRAFRYCWAAALSPREITEGLGITDASTRSRLNSACAALKKAGLLADAGQGRYRVNQEEVTRLRALSALRK